MVMTSRRELGDIGKKADFWLEEFAAPYYAFLDAGAMVTVASPKGGRIPLHPKSDLTKNTELMKRFKKDRAAQAALAETVKLNDITADDYDAVFSHAAACENL
jgi:putative intracellular protease/amidase